MKNFIWCCDRRWQN